MLTDGWDHHARRRAARAFKLNWAEMEERHQLVFETYEEGRLTLTQYLDKVVFYRKRPFTRTQWRRFMFAQSKPYPEMLELIARLKARYRLRIAVVSNEGRELNAFRIHKFKLGLLADLFVSSCFVHVRKPDVAIFHLALDIAQVPPREAIYIDNTAMFTEIAESLGIRSIFHVDYPSTRAKLGALGLTTE